MRGRRLSRRDRLLPVDLTENRHQHGVTRVGPAREIMIVGRYPRYSVFSARDHAGRRRQLMSNSLPSGSFMPTA
jgi:hypothetical protein